MVVSSVITGNGSSPTDLVHVAYIGDGEELFMFGAPGCKISAKTLLHAGQEMTKYLRLKFGSLSKAFDATNADDLDGGVIGVRQQNADLRKMFSTFFIDLLLDVDEIEKSGFKFSDMKTIYSQNAVPFESETSSAQWLRLPDEIKFQVDDALVQLESAYFQDPSDDFYDLPREFHIVGSAIFHKGLLVSSHLVPVHLCDVFTWCKASKILRITRSQPLHRLVAWNEIFPEEIAEPETRHFLLIVGRDHQVLSILLQTGGCTAQPSGVVRPEPFYVDQAMNTLDHLQEMGIPLVCDKWLTLPANPDLLNVDKLYDQNEKKKEKKSSHISPGPGVVLCRTKVVSHDSGSLSGGDETSSEPNNSCSDLSEELQTAFREEIEEDSGREKMLRKSYSGLGRSLESEDESSAWQLPRSGHRSNLNFSDIKNTRGSNSGGTTSHNTSIEGNGSDVDQLVAYKVSQLSLSQNNVIFHYLHLDVGEGVFLAPLDPSTSPLHSEVLNQFRAACHIIHANFEMALRSREALRIGGNSKTWNNKNLVAIKEQAMLFHWKPQPPLGSKHSLPLLSYWVCGRLFGTPGSSRECFVAYHESAPQLVVEMAFRLAYGVQL